MGEGQMKVTADSNVLIRAAVQDDFHQARRAAKILAEADLIARHTRNSYVGLPTFPRSGLGTESGKPNYVIIYGEGCFNSKRQAQRTVELHNKYRSRVHFVVIDLDIRRSPEQQKLVKHYYKGYIPHVLVLAAHGEALYNQSGEVDSEPIENIFEKALGH